MKVMSFLRDDGACGYYRLTLPLSTMAKNTDANVLMIGKGDPLSKIVEGVTTDAMVFPRVAEEGALELMDVLQNRGIKFIIDYDDNMFAVSPLSPHYKEFGIEEVKLADASGQVIHEWKDGHTFNLKENIARLDAIKRALEKADALFVTTEVLKQAYSQYNDNIKILPNCVDLNLWKKLPLKRENEDEVRLYWSGGASHFEDLLIVHEVIPALMEKYPQLKWVLMGQQFLGITKKCPQDQIEYHPWVPTPAYPYKTAILDADISVIPLADTLFNSCKSNIKWIEQSALFVPSVVSFVSPYKEHYDGANGVFVENNTPEGFYKGIEMLINDPLLRYKVGGAARRTVEQNFDIQNEYIRWYQALQEVINA